MRVLSSYWRDDRKVVNLGDALGEYLLGKMGHQFVRYGGGEEFDNDECLLTVGSILDSRYLSNLRGNLKVWGSGSFGNTFSQKGISYHAVRGPLTRDLLGLPKDTVLGDPAVLLPIFLEVSKGDFGKVLYVPHCASREDITLAEVASVGAYDTLDITCKREQIEDRVREIASASFVLAGSLHAAIIAQAYGTPWAICIPPGRKLVMPFKHKDWAAYLGIKPAVVTNISEGKSWWNHEGHKGQLRDTSALLTAFPY